MDHEYIPLDHPSRVNMIGHDVAIVGKRYLANGSSAMFDWFDAETLFGQSGD